MARRRLALIVVLWVLWAVMAASPAAAACHIAAFVEGDAVAQEATGVVSLVVELQGRVGSCAGTVDVATVDGTAVAGEDYEPVSRTLTYEANDDRVETVDVTILADDADDAGETFTLELSNPTGDISGTGDPATVTIQDGASGGADDAGEAADTEASGAPDGETTTPADDGGSGNSGTFGIALAVVVAIGIGIGAFVTLRGRGG